MNPAAARRLTLAMFLFSCAAGCTDPKVAERALHFDYVASISEVPEGAKKVDIWIPVPQDDETLKISNL